jgi:hypothetical protein
VVNSHRMQGNSANLELSAETTIREFGRVRQSRFTIPFRFRWHARSFGRSFEPSLSQ